LNRGVFLDRDSVDRGDLDLSGLQASLPEWRLHDASSYDQVAARIAAAMVVVSNKVLLDEAALHRAPGLKLICVAATGTNNVDLDAARALGITVCNVRAYATPSVVQHVFGLLLALSTRLLDYRRLVQHGGWQTSTQFCRLDFPIRELTGKTLGIVGLGELGRAVAQTAAAFGMEVLVAQRPGGPSQPGRVALDDLLRRVDALSLHCPLTPETHGLIGARELALMKPDAVLINAARGGIVDEEALAEALRAGRLGGAGVDVLSEEPPTHGNALLADDIPNLIVTPHVAWASRESRQRLIDQLVTNVRAFLDGTPRNVLT